MADGRKKFAAIWDRWTHPVRRRLSAQLLLLTIFFVMLAEILIFVPSIANFRVSWLTERLAAAQIAALALEASDDNMVSADLRNELLANAQVFAVILHRNAARRLILSDDMPPEVQANFDLRGAMPWTLIGDALSALAGPDGRIIHVVGSPRHEAGDAIEIVIDETPLRTAMWAYAVNILSLSIIISVITAGLVFLALNRVMVRPIRKLTENMVQFRQEPEDAARIIEASDRADEIGIAERELATMQNQIRATLHQQARLAALGTAVSKINHDLRNMLAGAQLISDRLGNVADPTVQTLAPRLFASIDRAIDLCTKTLKFGTAEEASPRRRLLDLHGLTGEVFETIGVPAQNGVDLVNEVPPDLKIDADPDHLYRILQNLTRNAVQAIEASGSAGQVTVRARRVDRRTEVEIEDTGPGLPARALENLFQPFAGAARSGGTGLGLAICADLVRMHGGEIALRQSDASGTRFWFVIPDRFARDAGSGIIHAAE